MTCHALGLYAQNDAPNKQSPLTAKQQSIITISALTARGELQTLKPALNQGMDAGMSINEIKEVLVHLYAYCGFPRSIRGLQTFMEVLAERKADGIIDVEGAGASPINHKADKYERGRTILGELTQTAPEKPMTGYGAFAPVIDIFLKEHLFADIFERDVLTHAERELVTISVISAIGNAAPMLRAHLNICLNVGYTPSQLQHFVSVIKPTIGKKAAKEAQRILSEELHHKRQ
ncbi:carboxymuconolactone decarboxylase family protein [Breznakibacter xylanolyticus]|uniref:Carboxymuconolactone decarboxylase family protein n=2 Tax=Breznakibacter xylanolyticus TaxID=990 RepID=A0A2W7NH86_9BACT|nr:carboxymuconolactone decarboxylase family protein [Breznakibacter xylanolyticus]